jgi:serine/threonine protein kinase
MFLCIHVSGLLQHAQPCSSALTLTEPLPRPQAPEVIRHAKGSKASDVYSFSIVLWELAHPGVEVSWTASSTCSTCRPGIPFEASTASHWSKTTSVVERH